MFEKGNPGGPGRPRGSRTLAVDIIYEVFEQYGAARFKEMMKAEVNADPVKFYSKYINPILPKEQTINTNVVPTLLVNSQPKKEDGSKS